MTEHRQRLQPPLPRWLRCCLALLLALVTGLGAAPAQAQARAHATSSGLERQVKAAYLYKFASFVEWPPASFARPDSALEIGVAGSAPLAEQLERMVTGRSVGGHPLKVRRIARGEALDQLHILFLDNSLDPGAMVALLDAARGHALLTVSDARDATVLGCMIGFVIAADKLRFEVAMRPVSLSRLRISARMLAVAHKVQAAT